MREYEEMYVPGKWEEFNEKQPKNKGLVYWMRRCSSAAAILIFGVGIYIFIQRNPVSGNEEISGGKIRPEIHRLAEPVNSKVIMNEKAQSISNAKLSNAVAINHRKIKRNENITTAILGVDNALLALKDQVPLKNIDITLANIKEPVKTPNILSDNKNNSFEEFLEKNATRSLDDSNVISAGRTRNNWKAGVVLSPSYGLTKKINMGYGLSVAYIISEKIDVSSGITYNEMAGSRLYDQLSSRSIINGKSLESAESVVSGIDIPLEVKYHLTKYIYANIGVSAFAVLDEKRENTYVEAKFIERTVPTTTGGLQVQTFIENQRTTLKVPDAQNREDRFLGLYNFSFGYKRKLSANKSVSFEPFMKVPVKKPGNQDLRMIGTGLRLRLEF